MATNTYFKKNAISQISKFTLGYLGLGQLIGEEDAITNNINYSNTV